MHQLSRKLRLASQTNYVVHIIRLDACRAMAIFCMAACNEVHNLCRTSAITLMSSANIWRCMQRYQALRYAERHNCHSMLCATHLLLVWLCLTEGTRGES